MNNDLQSLLDALASIMGPGARGPVSNPGERAPFRELPNLSGGRRMTPQERQQRGIDPRDPNTYDIMPDGSVFGTLMGWSPERGDGPGMPGMGNMPGMFKSPFFDDQMRASPVIPRANKRGMTRLSPGVYRNKRGKVVRRAKG